MRSEIRRAACGGLLAFAVVCVAGAAQVPHQTVVLVKSGTLPPFEAAARAIVAGLQRRTPQPEILTFDLDGDEAVAARVLERVRAANPGLIVTVGSLATAAVLRDPPAAPVVFSMVLYPDQSGFRAGRGSVTGASLDIPSEAYFDLIRRILPSARRAGVLFDQAETGVVVEAARRSAAAVGLTLVTRQVSDPAQAPAAMAALLEEVDVVWAVADSHVFTPQTTPELILASMRRSIPLIGLSAAHVRSGALAALVCDYADVGGQAAELAARVLDGERAERLAVTAPRRFDVAVNLKSAAHLGVSIPADIVARAGVTIQ